MVIPAGKRTVTAAVYLSLRPTYNSNKTAVTGIGVHRITQGKPTLAAGDIAVRVKLNFDAESLMQAIPEIEVDVNGFSTPLSDILTGGT